MATKVTTTTTATTNKDNAEPVYLALESPTGEPTFVTLQSLIDDAAIAAFAAATESRAKTPAGKHGKPAPVIREAGSPEACAAIRAYGLTPISVADGWAASYGGVRDGFRARAPRKTALSAAAFMLHTGLKAGPVPADVLYRLLIVAIESGFPALEIEALGESIPETAQPSRFLDVVCRRFNCGILLQPDSTLILSTHKADRKPGQSRWLPLG